MYYNFGNTAVSNLTSIGESNAVCDSGDITLGGNYGINSAAVNTDFLVTFNGNVGTDKYSIIIQNFDTHPGAIEFSSVVFCFDNPPTHIP